MRFPTMSLCLIGATASFSTTVVAQSCPAGEVVLPGYASTFTSASATRGYYFQAPVSMTIDALNVPDEGLLGEQSVELFIDNAAPPAYASVSTPPLVFSAYQVSSLTPILTGGIAVSAGQWVIVMGAASSPGSTTMANSYPAAGIFSTTVGGVPVDITRCGTQASIAATPGGVGVWSESGGPPSRVEMCVTITGAVPPSLVGVSEANPGTLPLAGVGGTVRGLDFISWNYDDSVGAGASLGLPALTVWNIGVGTLPTGVTAALPGLVQLNAASTPAGNAVITGPNVVGAANGLFFIPPGILSNGDQIRAQALILDLNPALTLPISPMFNVLTWTYTNCGYVENFDASGAFPAGYVQSGTQNWIVDASGTSSGATGPTAASSLPNYVYAETSSPSVTGDTFIFDTSPVASANAPTSTLNFNLSRIGATTGTLDVSMDDGTGTFNLLASYVGPSATQTQGGIEWDLESLDLTQGGTLVVPANIVIRFHYTKGASFTGDLAIDDICFN